MIGLNNPQKITREEFLRDLQNELGIDMTSDADIQ
jgi:hypothetical protein